MTIHKVFITECPFCEKRIEHECTPVELRQGWARLHCFECEDWQTVTFAKEPRA